MPLMSVLLDRVAIWLATGLGVGLVSPAPGTIGSLWGLLLVWAIDQLPGTGGQIAVILLVLVLSSLLCTRAARVLGGRSDPQEIVLDEIVALPIVFVGLGDKSPALWLTGWLLFRVFDISKPPPVRQLERLPEGWGIVADDVAAAIYALLVLRGAIWLDGLLTLGWLQAPA